MRRQFTLGPSVLVLRLCSCLGLGVAACDEAALDPPAQVARRGDALSTTGDILPVSPPPRIDGVPDLSWGAVESRVASQVLRGTAQSSRELYLSWQAMYDADYLYVLASVMDDRLVRDSDHAWEDDSLEIYLDGDASRLDTYDGRNDFQYVIPFGPENVVQFGVNSKPDARGVQVRLVPTRGSGYVAEVAIPWSTIGISPHAGSAIGLDVHVNDDDDGGARDRKYGTFATVDDAWANPRSFGRLILGSFADNTADVTGGATEPVVDGVAEAAVWDAAPVRHAIQPVLGTSALQADLSASWRATWTSAGLYIFASVRDDARQWDSPSPWEDDSLEIYLDGDNSKGLAYDGTNDYQLVFRPGDPTVHLGVRSATDVAGIRFVTLSTPGSGYVLEAFVPWSLLGPPSTSGHRIGIDVQVNDDDDGGARDSKIATFAATDDAWTRPALFGAVGLGPLPRGDHGRRVEGHVYDALSGAPIAGARVVASACPDCPRLEALSDAMGAWSIDGCVSGDPLAPRDGADALQLSVSRAGYRTSVLHQPSAVGSATCQRLERDPVLYPESVPDTDGDGLTDLQEGALGTDPSAQDSDGDALPDDWELHGHDYVDLPSHGADPRRRDVFVECSYMAGRRPPDGALTIARQTFADAPIINRDGSRGIHLWIELTDEVPYGDDLSPSGTEFDAIKSQFFPPMRRSMYHYCVFANQYDSSNSSGLAFGVPGVDFIVSLGWAWDQADMVGGTILHELGHDLGLGHGGSDFVNYKPNYMSVMSYGFQFFGVTIDGTDHHYDYSRHELATLDEAALNEVRGLDMADGSSDEVLRRYTVFYYPVGAGNSKAGADVDVDWNADGRLEAMVTADLNLDTSIQQLTGWNDWAHLIYDGGGRLGQRGVVSRQRPRAPVVCLPVPARR